MNRRSVLGTIAALGTASVGGCVDTVADQSTPTRAPWASPGTLQGNDALLAVTTGSVTGNRVAPGAAALDSAAALDVELSGTPGWLVAAGAPPDATPDGRRTHWVVATAEGTLDVVTLTDGTPGVGTVTPPTLPAGTPPAFLPASNRVLEPPAGASTLTHPLPTSAGTVVVRQNGDLLVGDAIADVDALPDARVAVADEFAAVLAGATREYDHGVLGDDLEASTVAVVSLSDGAVSTFQIDGGVVEGTSPILADVTGDGTTEILVTVSDRDRGAHLVAYDRTGSVRHRGPAIGGGYRWRHQLAVVPFGTRATGDDGETTTDGPDPGSDPVEIAVVKTPHIGGTVEFYAATADGLEITATAAGYSTHTIGSRNLDAARAMDADGDGAFELVVPTDARDHLAILDRTPDGVTERARRPLDGRLRGNVATATVDGRTSVGVTTTDNRLRIWPG